jgi:iron complex outermembrane receptor protein
MTQHLHKKFLTYLRRTIAAGLAGSLLVSSTTLAQDANAPAKMKPTVVTGSLIPTAETVGPSPIDMVGTEAIEKTGQQDILSALKVLSPGFSGSGNIGQTLNNGGFGEAYVAIRNLPTLVLIDGKRVNITPFSTFVGTYAVDINSIPLAAIERIDVYKDGASTTYGSDAIGGVVNIITKHRPDAGRPDLISPFWSDVDGHYGFGLDKGRYNEYRISADVGYSKGPTRALAGAQYYTSDPIYTKDRSPGGITAQQLHDLGLIAPTYYSPSYPGRIDSYLLAGSPLAAGAPGYIAGLNTPPNDAYIMAQMALLPTSSRNIPNYNTIVLTDPAWTSVHGSMAPYIPISTTPTSQALAGSASILNTTELNTITVQRQDRRNAFANLEQDILDNHMTFYGQVLYSETESLGQLAPAPIPLLSLYNLTIPADNPYNIFQVPIGSGATNSTPRVRSRLIETGNRRFDSIGSSWHFVTGLKGDVLDDKYHYDVSAGYSQTTQEQIQNSADSGLVNLAMQPFGGAGLSQLTDASGNHLPLYNMFALPGLNSGSTINAIKAADGQGGFSDLLDVSGVFRGDLFELPAGQFQLAAGGQWLSERLKTAAGPVLASGDLIGLLAIPPFSGGTRDRYAGFIEAHIPVISPDKNIPGVHDLYIDAAGRYEVIQSRGITHEAAVPKVGFHWQPLDEQVTLRGTYSQGFVVEPLIQLFGPPLNSSPTVVTPASASPPDPTPTAVQQNINFTTNPDLAPSHAETFTLGAVISPKAVKNLTVSVDYYHIQGNNVPFYPAGSAVVADLNARGSGSSYFNNPALHGTPIYTVNGAPYVPTPGDPTTFIAADNFDTLNLPLLQNGSERVEGIDFGLNYKLETKQAGTFNLFANANLTLAFDFNPGAGQYYSYKGQYTDVPGAVVAAPQGTIPDYNITTGVTWSFFNFDYTVLAHYLPGIVDLGDTHGSVGSPVDHFTLDRTTGAPGGPVWRVPAYFKIDMQLAYNFRSESGKKWYDGTRIAVGVNNITDEAAPIIASSSEDNTDKGTYDILGRFVYFEVSKKF